MAGKIAVTVAVGLTAAHRGELLSHRTPADSGTDEEYLVGYITRLLDGEVAKARERTAQDGREVVELLARVPKAKRAALVKQIREQAAEGKGDEL